MRISMHAGHVGELAGHDHWVAGVGIGVIIAAGLAAWWGGRRSDKEEAPEAEADEAEDQPA